MFLSSLGVSSTLFPELVWARFEQDRNQKITIAMLKDAAAIAGLEFSESQYESMVKDVNHNLEVSEALRRIKFDDDLTPPTYFSPIVPGLKIERIRHPFRASKPPYKQ